VVGVGRVVLGDDPCGLIFRGTHQEMTTMVPIYRCDVVGVACEALSQHKFLVELVPQQKGAGVVECG